jgi:hypothetical protein
MGKNLVSRSRKKLNVEDVRKKDVKGNIWIKGGWYKREMNAAGSLKM